MLSLTTKSFRLPFFQIDFKDLIIQWFEKQILNYVYAAQGVI